MGATVMPHNLYLHSALVQSRRYQRDDASIRTAIRLNTIDSSLALTVAFFVNAAILVLAAMVFHGRESVQVGGEIVHFGADADWIRVAYLTLAPLLGTGAASVLFAVALLASRPEQHHHRHPGRPGGDGGVHALAAAALGPAHHHPALAVLPAVVIIGIRGDSSVTDLLTLSQVVLALQLPFAMFPLLHFTSSRTRMGKWRNGWLLLAFGWGSALVITALDLYGLPDSVSTAWRIITGP